VSCRTVRRRDDLATLETKSALAATARRKSSCARLSTTTSDGVNREQAIWYHHEVADLMLLTALVARANGRDFRPPTGARLETMLEFLASIMDSGGHVPNFGDADDGCLVRRSASQHCSG